MARDRGRRERAVDHRLQVVDPGHRQGLRGLGPRVDPGDGLVLGCLVELGHVVPLLVRQRMSVASELEIQTQHEDPGARMPLTDYDSATCSIAKTAQILGDRWSVLVVRNLFNGVRRFDALQQHLGIARDVLTKRLALLVDEGIVERRAYQPEGERAPARVRPHAGGARPAHRHGRADGLGRRAPPGRGRSADVAASPRLRRRDPCPPHLRCGSRDRAVDPRRARPPAPARSCALDRSSRMLRRSV